MTGPAMAAKARDPERRRKIGDAHRGRTPRNAVEAARLVNTGRRHTAEAREKMSKANRARGARPPWLNDPWSADEDALLSTHTTKEVAAKTGRTLPAVRERRRILGISYGRKRAGEARVAAMYAHCGDVLPQLREMRDTGSLYRELAEWLNRAGYRTHAGDEWTANRVRTMLLWFEKQASVMS